MIGADVVASMATCVRRRPPDDQIILVLEVPEGCMLPGERPLGMEVAIRPSARSEPYPVSVPRLETGNKRSFSLGELTEHGARINLDVVRPKEIVVTASDFVGKKPEVSLPWKP